MTPTASNLPAACPARSSLPAHVVPSRVQPARPPGVWLELLCFLLLGYALFGKGWAYVGLPPLFIGELLMLAGVIGAALYGRWTGFLSLAPFYLLLALAIVGSLRTLPFLGEYGIDAIRDAMLWGYGIFAVIVYGFLMAQPDRLQLMIRWYGHFSLLFILIIPGIWTVSNYFPDHVPRWPSAEVPVVHAKAGDVMVHVAGVLAFSVLMQPMRIWQLLIFGCIAAAVGIATRAGLLAFLSVFGICTFFRPAARSLISLTAVGVLGVLLLVVTGVQISSAKGRTLSADGLIDTVFSITEETDEGNLDGTKAWRLNWWTDIWDYTVNGPYRWSGKGFGINLADDDGYQGTDWEGKLRSPHNAHMTVLARGGVPSFAIWATLHLSWLIVMIRAYVLAARVGQRGWMNLYLFTLAYWTAFMINASFDVFLEGPMGGIWFWSLFGFGLAATELRRRLPELLGDGEKCSNGRAEAASIDGAKEHEVSHG